MGNRAVIVSADTTRENANKKIGLYVHWAGSPDDIQQALDKAQAKARELNKEYGDCCDFTPDGDFIQVKDDCYFENAHYYTVESKNIK